MKIGFFRAVSGVVSGTAIFQDLRVQSWWRVILHLILFSFLLSLFISWLATSGTAKSMTALEGSFTTEFGSYLEVTPEGIIPEKSAAKRRFFSPAPGTLLAYLGNSSKVKLDKDSLLKYDALLIWGRKKLATGVRGKGGLWQLHIATPDKNRMIRCMEKELPEELNKSTYDTSDDWDWPEVKIYTADLFRTAATTMRVLHFFYYFLMMLSLPWLYTGVFVLITAIFGNRQYRRLGLRGLWKCGIYAGFPAMIVGAAFPALDLPWLDYSTVYMLGLIIYWMLAAMRTEMWLAAADTNGFNSNNDGNNDNE